MINKEFWLKIASNWAKEDDGLVVPQDQEEESKKVVGITGEDLVAFTNISNDEIDDILADLGLDEY